ncbi:hypothetical protein BH10CYA1_BH10CYA1_63400 [soil metagenome]
MSRKRTGSKPVPQKKRKDPLHCGTITAADQNRMRKASERQNRIESGMLRPVGTGAHWKGKKGESRADRRAARQQTNQATRDY